MAAHHVDHQPSHQQYTLPHFTAPHQHQAPHPTQQSTSASPQPQYYHTPQDHTNGYTNTQTYVDPQQPAYTVAPTNIQQHPQIPAQSITQETYQSPVIAQPGSDWAKDLIRQARTAELKKHSLTLQLHTAQVLSAHSSLEQRNKKLEDVRAEKAWLESERSRLLECLREVNEDREKVDLHESSLLKEINEFKAKIKTITEGEYGTAKKEVDTIRKELGMPPVPSLQATMEEKSASSHNKRRLEQSNEEPTVNTEEIPATVPSSIVRPSLYSMAQANGTVSIKRGPGRPRKVTLDGNGEPAAVPGPSTAPGQDGESPAKRPRGRPKGSKNKPKLPLPSEPALTGS